jgi:hypothetical protein
MAPEWTLYCNGIWRKKLYWLEMIYLTLWETAVTGNALLVCKPNRFLEATASP